MTDIKTLPVGEDTHSDEFSQEEELQHLQGENNHPVKWYRGTWYNCCILGFCQFLAPGLWGAMNSLGAGGLMEPEQVNQANAITFCIMWLTALVGSALTRVIGVRATLAFGTAGYAPYSAALYCNSKYGTQWFMYFGAALCGLTAGIFWMIEAAIALSYPEPHRKGRLLSFWMVFRVMGQIVGGSINLGVNRHKNSKGGISTNVYIVFIVLQCLGPPIAFLLTPPEKVERTDGKKVNFRPDKNVWGEFVSTIKLYTRLDFVLFVPFVVGTVWWEAVSNTYIATYFSVRARALGSFLSAVCCITTGLLEGAILDLKIWDTKTKKRGVFCFLAFMQLGVWVWSTINTHQYDKTNPVFDWDSSGFGRAFALYLFMAMNFQMCYIFGFAAIGDFARTPAEIIRLAALTRGSESAAQAISYGVASVDSLIMTGLSAINFGVMGASIIPAGYIVWKFGVGKYAHRQNYDPGVIEDYNAELESSTEESIKEKI